ncbi:MAG: hypothetical protein ABI346_00370 [Candidatus Baltobacteraceae bacterium]
MRALLILALGAILTAPAISKAVSAPPFNPNLRLHYGRGYVVLPARKVAPTHRKVDTAAIQVVASLYDPYHTNLVASQWIAGLGCPTNARIATPTIGSFTDAACLTGDPRDHRNFGLLLTKTGPTGNYAAGQATLTNVSGLTLTEIGWDLRSGSHCGGGAPRFDVVTLSDNVDHFIGCNSPPPTIIASSPAWARLRYDVSQAFPPITSPVGQIYIIFDEGQDTGPDYSGQAVIDNIDINGTLIGRGPAHH